MNDLTSFYFTYDLFLLTTIVGDFVKNNRFDKCVVNRNFHATTLSRYMAHDTIVEYIRLK